MASKTVSIFVNVKGNAQKALKGIGTQLGKNQKQVSKSAIGWKKLAGAVGGMVVLNRVNAWMKESARLAMVQERAEKRLEAVYGKNIDTLKKYASALQLKTTFGDEEILLAQSKLAVFVKEEDQLKALTKATLDFAVVTGMDLDSAFALVGKSVGSSTNALTRYGVEVKGAVGSVERINSAVGNLNKLFEGAAEADAFTSAGKIKQMENAIGDLREEVGIELLPAMIKVKEASLEFYNVILRNKGSVISAVTAIANTVSDTVLGWEFILGGEKRTELAGIVSDTKKYLKERTRLQQELTMRQINTVLYSKKQREFTKAEIVELDNARKAWKDLVKAKREIITQKNEPEEADTGKSKTQKEKDAAKATLDAWKKSFNDRYNAKIAFLQADEDLEAKWAGIAEENKKIRQDEEDADAQTRKETAIAIAQQTAQGVQMVMSAVNNKRQQDLDNEIRQQKEAVEESNKSAKQKAKALKKIDEQASKDRLKLRVAEWRQSLVMSIVNTAVAITSALPNIAKSVAVGVLGGIQTGIIAGNKPKFYNGGEVHSKTGMLGDVIPVMAREGEVFSTPSQQAAEKGKGGNVINYAPVMNFPAEATELTKQTFRSMLNEQYRDIEDMFVNGSINASKINGALAV